MPLRGQSWKSSRLSSNNTTLCEKLLGQRRDSQSRRSSGNTCLTNTSRSSFMSWKVEETKTRISR